MDFDMGCDMGIVEVGGKEGLIGIYRRMVFRLLIEVKVKLV